MKKQFFQFTLAVLLLGGFTIQSCKSKSKGNDTSTTTSTTTNMDTATTTSTAPVTISADSTLQTGVRDATKDYPGVHATVNNGEITLTGEIKRDRLPKLMQSLNSLQPKKINNKLTVK